MKSIIKALKRTFSPSFRCPRCAKALCLTTQYMTEAPPTDSSPGGAALGIAELRRQEPRSVILARKADPKGLSTCFVVSVLKLIKTSLSCAEQLPRPTFTADQYHLAEASVRTRSVAPVTSWHQQVPGRREMPPCRCVAVACSGPDVQGHIHPLPCQSLYLWSCVLDSVRQKTAIGFGAKSFNGFPPYPAHSFGIQHLGEHSGEHSTEPRCSNGPTGLVTRT